jgi:hypothetical protein
LENEWKMKGRRDGRQVVHLFANFQPDNVPCVGIDRDDCGGAGRLAGGLTQKHLSVKKNLPGRIELLQEIKIKNIAGQHGAAMLSSCGE